MSKRSAKLYLDDILSSIANVEQYTKELSFEEFVYDRKTIDAVVRNLEIIGEAAKNLPEKITAQYPNIPWNRIISMRNKVIHEYFGVDVDILWETMQEDLPELRRQIKDIQKATNAP